MNDSGTSASVRWIRSASGATSFAPNSRTEARTWSAGPVNAFSLWQPGALKVTKGADQIATYNKSTMSFRKWCKQCGGHLFTDHPPMGMVDIYAAMLPSLAFKPAVHVNYGEKVLSIRDGRPKQKDFPKEMGGSGTILAE